MSLRYNIYDYQLFVFGSSKPVKLSITHFPLDGLFVRYVLGLYIHEISLSSNGLIEEKIHRGEKLISSDTSSPKVFFNAPPSSTVINTAKFCLVSGAGNGILGFGVTKIERFEQLYFNLVVHKDSCFTVDLEQASSWTPTPILHIDFYKSLDISERLSDAARRI